MAIGVRYDLTESFSAGIEFGQEMFYQKFTATAANGDVVNKIGTLAKAICAREFGIPFYVAAPPSTFDAATPDGRSVEIEERGEDEVHYQTGPDDDGALRRIRVASPGSPARNPAFDATPARLVTAYVTRDGILTRDRLFAPSSSAEPVPA